MSSKEVLKTIKDKQVEFVDLRFTDPKGKLQHLTMDSTIVDEDMLNNGVFFDGSSIVFNSAFDASSVKDFSGGNMTTLYLPSIGERLSCVITVLISSTPNVRRLSDSTIFISGWASIDSLLNAIRPANFFACLISSLDEFENRR